MHVRITQCVSENEIEYHDVRRDCVCFIQKVLITRLPLRSLSRSQSYWGERTKRKSQQYINQGHQY